jgi:hypothetical protein
MLIQIFTPYPSVEVACSVERLFYGLDDKGIVVRLLAVGRNFSLLLSVHTGSSAHLASYSLGIEGPFLCDKAAGT